MLNSNEASQHVSLCLTKALCFLRNRKTNKASFENIASRSKTISYSHKNDSGTDIQEHFFLRYFKTMRNQNLKVDKIDTLLGCMRLYWH